MQAVNFSHTSSVLGQSNIAFFITRLRNNFLKSFRDVVDKTDVSDDNDLDKEFEEEIEGELGELGDEDFENQEDYLIRDRKNNQVPTKNLLITTYSNNSNTLPKWPYLPQGCQP